MQMTTKCFDCSMKGMYKYADEHIPENLRDGFNKEAVALIDKEISLYKDELKNLKAGEQMRFIMPSEIWSKVARKYLRRYDLYEEEKKQFQKIILDMRDDIEALLDDSDNPLLDAIKFAIAGNIIDFGSVPELNFEKVKEIIEDTKNADLDERVLNDLINELKVAENVVILHDNVGEVFFDYILIKKIKEEFPNINITSVPASYPVSSDATMAEVYEVGIADYAEVVPTGNGLAGTYLPRCSDECVKIIKNADVIIAKGMANLETMLGKGYNVYYCFLAKCDLYTIPLGVERFERVFMKEKSEKADKILAHLDKMMAENHL